MGPASKAGVAAFQRRRRPSFPKLEEPVPVGEPEPSYIPRPSRDVDGQVRRATAVGSGSPGAAPLKPASIRLGRR